MMGINSVFSPNKSGELDDDCSGGEVVFTPALFQGTGYLWKMKVSLHWSCHCTGAVTALEVSGRKKNLFLQHSSSSAHSHISSKTPKSCFPLSRTPISWAGPQPGEAQPQLTADMDKYRVNGTEMGGGWEVASRVSPLFVF